MPKKIQHPRSGELTFHFDPVQGLFSLKGTFRDANGVEHKLGHAMVRDWGALIETGRLLMGQASLDDWNAIPLTAAQPLVQPSGEANGRAAQC